MTIIQICGCTALHVPDITPFVSDAEAEFYGVYIGKPGDFQWAADFQQKGHALAFARTLQDQHGYEIDDKTFKE